MATKRRKSAQHTDYTGRKFGRHLTAEACVGVGKPTTSYPTGEPRWRCRCDCGGSIVLPVGRLHNILSAASESSCRECLPDRRTAQRERARDIWDRDPKVRLRRQWQDDSTLYSTADLTKLYRQIRYDFGLRWQYTEPTTHQPANGWEPPAEVRDDKDDRIGGGASLQEVADVLRVSRERARQIEATALYKVAVALYKLDPLLFDNKFPQMSGIRSAAGRAKPMTPRRSRAKAKQ